MFLWFILIIVFSATPATAENGKGWEVRAGFYDHDIKGLESHNVEPGIDFNMELIMPPIVEGNFLEYFRLRLGASISLFNKTDLFYGGVAFELHEEIAPFFITLGLDMAVHTGHRRANNKRFNALGCRWIFHESASLGFVFWKHHRLMATLEHASNASSVFDACTYNQGLTKAGLRYGYRF